MESRSRISPEVLSRYAADATREVPGVRRLVESHLPVRHRGVRISSDGDETHVELRVEVEWGSSIPDVAQEVQDRVSAYLAEMADIELASVDVVVDGVAAPAAATR